MKIRSERQLELWGGIECTINRNGDSYFDQLRRSGHIGRISDFELFAGLGIKALRYPVLWECGPSHACESEQWEWTKVALEWMSRFGICPILGLVHHGSGPKFTSLLDPDFSSKLAQYAEQVARRFPDVQDYTPVNEPLTTARFSSLYGHWYPHRKDEHSFACALLHQCRAVVLAMQAIRKINPTARLIQTDDFGKVYSTPLLAYQADFENHRRWATYDILCGRLDRTSRMWGHFRWAGVPEDELEWFLDNPCPPDIIGVNHYLSGERYLDEHLERYPANTHGGNGKHRYADVLAARVLQTGTSGPAALLIEAWERYKIPIAVTECHNGCTREEQLRWFVDVWLAAENARLAGAKILAVTAWSLLGAFDWDSLLTRNDNHYEPGVYDVRSGSPRSTAIAGLIQHLAKGVIPDTPLLQVPGWWRRPARFIYGISVDKEGAAKPAPNERIDEDYAHVRPILITGGNGTLGQAFERICESRGIRCCALPRQTLDINNSAKVRRALLELDPWAVINAAGYTQIDRAEVEAHKCFLENTQAAQYLAEECQRRKIPYLTFSCDQVFDGGKASAYIETDGTAPINIYGFSKSAAEKLVRAEMPDALIVRTGPLFDPWDGANFLIRALHALNAGQPFFAANDVIMSPTYTPDLVNACLDIFIDGEHGIWHLANQAHVSWADVVLTAARLGNVRNDTLESCSINDMNMRAKFPAYSALTSARGILLPSLEDALERFIVECSSRLPRPLVKDSAA